MKIISKFKDFYDGAQGLGYDDSLVFVRHSAEFDYTNRGVVVPDYLRGLLALPQLSFKIWGEVEGKKTELQLRSGHVVFCGIDHPFIEVSWGNPTKWVYCYGMAKFKEALAKLGIKEWQEAERVHPRSWWLEGVGAGDPNVVPRVFDKRVSFMDWAIENKCPVAYCGQTSGVFKNPYSPYPGQAEKTVTCKPKVEVNPCLANLEFGKVMPAPQAYQELSMFLGNITAPDNVPIVVSDKDRIQQHGFDKFSFRKPPGKRGKG